MMWRWVEWSCYSEDWAGCLAWDGTEFICRQWSPGRLYRELWWLDAQPANGR